MGTLLECTEMIDQTTLVHLVDSGSVRGAEVIGTEAGWGVVVKYGTAQRTLKSKRGTVRTWRHFETLVEYLRGLGIVEYVVHAADFAPKASTSAPRSLKAAERMREAHAAAAYQAWFNQEIEAALQEADDPAQLLTQAEVSKRHQSRRKKLLAKIGKGAAS